MRAKSSDANCRFEIKLGPYRWSSLLHLPLLLMIDVEYRSEKLEAHTSVIYFFTCEMQQGAADHPLHVACITRWPEGMSNVSFRIFPRYIAHDLEFNGYPIHSNASKKDVVLMPQVLSIAAYFSPSLVKIR